MKLSVLCLFSLSLLLSFFKFYFYLALSSCSPFLSFIFSYPFAVISTPPHPPPTVILPLCVCLTPQIALSEVHSGDRETKIETWVRERERERERERNSSLLPVLLSDSDLSSALLFKASSEFRSRFLFAVTRQYERRERQM